MTTANLQIETVLFKRGNTTSTSTYTGVLGEIVIDTTLHTLRVQDGVTAGGYALASASDAANIATFGANIGVLTSNAATQATQISLLNANVAAVNVAIASLNLTGTYSNSNVTSYLPTDSIIIGLQSNALTQSLAISSLQSNAAIQAGLIDSLTGNAATQGGVLSDLVANAAVQSAGLTTLLSNAAVQADELNILLGNAATQFSAISDLQSNAATQATQISSINANVANVAPTLTNGAYQFKLQANGNVTTNSDSFFITPADTDIGIKTTGATGRVNIGWVDNTSGDQATVNYTTDGIEFHTTDSGVQRYWRFRVNGATEFPLFNFPVGSGSPGQRLTTNGIGQLYWDTPANLRAESGNITANQDAVYSLGEPDYRWKVLYSANVVVGEAGHQFLPNSVAEFSGNVDSYSQINFRNQSGGTAATTDYVLTANNGTDTEYYLDVGLASSGYDNTNPVNSLGNVITGNDGYIYIQGNASSAIGGNLALGVTTAGKHVAIFAGGVDSDSEVAKFDSTGVTVTGNLELTNGTTYSNSIVTLPTTTNGTTNSFLWKFSDLLVGNETVTLNWNLLGANASTFLIGTGLASTPGYFNFNGIDKTLGFISNSGTEGDGKLTFGANTNGGAGNVNDIELTTVTGNVYIRAGGDSWKFDNDGKLTAPGEVYGQFFTIRGGNGPGTDIGSLGYGGNVVTVHSYEGFNIETGAVESGPQWQFGTDGNLTLPGHLIVTTGIVGTDASPAPYLTGFGSITTTDLTAGNITVTGTGGNVVTKATGSWTVTSGTNNYSFTVTPGGTYQLWVLGNIPNGIIKWNATATISNTNVPVAGAQYTWVYDGGGTPLDFTSIPTQFIGTSNTIVRSSGIGVANAHIFTFGINNSSGSDQTVTYGWIKIS